MAGCTAVAFGLLGAVAGHPAFAQNPPAKGAIRGAADPKTIRTPPANAPPTKEAAEIDSLRGQLNEATKRINDAETRANNAEKRASDAAKYAGDARKRASDAGKRANDAEQRASEMENRANDAEKRAREAAKRADEAEQRASEMENRANDVEKRAREAAKRADEAEQRASDAEDNAATTAKAAAGANELAENLREQLEQVTSTATVAQKDLDEARAEVQKRVANESTVNSQVERLNSRISVLETVVKTRGMELLLYPSVAMLLGCGLGFVLARVFPKPRPRISIPPGATARVHVVLNMAQSETRIEGAYPTGPNVRVAATLGPGITSLIFPQGASR